MRCSAVTCSSSSATRAVLQTALQAAVGRVPLRDASRLAACTATPPGVIAAVFEPLQALHKDGNDVARGYRADDAAHGWCPPIKPMRRMVGSAAAVPYAVDFSMKVKFNFTIHPHLKIFCNHSGFGIPPLDAIDLQLLDLLQTMPPKATRPWPNRCMCRPTCLRRVKRLHDVGLIERQVALPAARPAGCCARPRAGLHRGSEPGPPERRGAGRPDKPRAVQDWPPCSCSAGACRRGRTLLLVVHTRDSQALALSQGCSPPMQCAQCQGVLQPKRAKFEQCDAMRLISATGAAYLSRRINAASGVERIAGAARSRAPHRSQPVRGAMALPAVGS